MNIEFVFLTDLETSRNLKHEPTCVAPGIGINFHQKVVFINALQVGGVQVATFKILVEF